VCSCPRCPFWLKKFKAGKVQRLRDAEFSTRMVWAGDQWDVALTEVTDERTHLLATIPLDDWIGLSATLYVLEMETEGASDATLTREPVEQEQGAAGIRRGSLARQPTPSPFG
jgi:hypothetical protein